MAAAEDDWPAFVLEFCEVVAADEDNVVTWDRRHSIWPLWYLSALQARKENARLFFDSLQHTVSVRCVPVRQGVAIGRGACAFATPYAASTVDVSWCKAGWHLAVGGVLVS